MSGDTVHVNGMWFQVVKGKNTVAMVSRQHGRYVGHVVNTLAGTQVLFSHHGHRYQDEDAKSAFSKMAERELS